MNAKATAASDDARRPDLIGQMSALTRTVDMLEKAGTFEKLELAPVALAQARGLLDSLVCEVMALRGAMKGLGKNGS